MHSIFLLKNRSEHPFCGGDYSTNCTLGMFKQYLYQKKKKVFDNTKLGSFFGYSIFPIDNRDLTFLHVYNINNIHLGFNFWDVSTDFGLLSGVRILKKYFFLIRISLYYTKRLYIMTYTYYIYLFHTL